MKKVSFPTLDEMVEIIQTNKGIKRIEVQGHTDDRGSDAKNLALSERRAVAVRKYLIKAGLNPELIVASGKGESQPEVSVEGLEGAALDAARAKNRRVHFIIVP